MQSPQTIASSGVPRRSSFVSGMMEDALSWVLIIDLTCHGQWHTSQVRRQPPCSGSFACLKKHLALVPLLNLQWQGSKIVLRGLADYLALLSPNLNIKAGCPRITALGQLPRCKMVIHRNCAVQKSEAANLQADTGVPRRSSFVLEDVGRWKMPCLESWFLIWHAMPNGILLKFDGSHHAAVVLLVCKSHPVLAKSHWCHFWSCTAMVPRMFFQAVLALRHIWAQLFTAKAAAQESQLWDSYQKDPEQTRCSAKKWSCEVVGSQLLSVFST